jgi:N-acetylmuramoyl-L-alanine amidase
MTFEELVEKVTAPAYVYSEQEKAYIARVVYAEARGETFEGKVAVAAVVLNRFESGQFGSTVKRVVFARNQFAVSRRYNDECMIAVTAAIDQRDAFPDDMYYFQASKRKHWRSFEYYTRIGNHSFYCA